LLKPQVNVHYLTYTSIIVIRFYSNFSRENQRWKLYSLLHKNCSETTKWKSSIKSLKI